MKIVNFGSLNIDLVYSVEDFVEPGQTIMSMGLNKYPGGKGLNQAVAVERAGAPMLYAGVTGPDGSFLTEFLRANGIDQSYLKSSKKPCGHAVIQVNREGENCIIVYPGANHDFDKGYVDEIFEHINSGDIILLQNEINLNKYILEKAGERGVGAALNPSPFNIDILEWQLENVAYFILNEDEGRAFTGKTHHMDILKAMALAYPKAEIVLTLGKKGSVVKKDDDIFHRDIFNVTVEDTTGAGDTFTGYYLASRLMNKDVEKSMELASAASALCVSRKGAATSIPFMEEVLEFMDSHQL